jgi:predicted nucleic acid-binding protein
VRDHCTVIPLNEVEYYDTMRHAAEHGFTSGRIYDALLLRCAMKSEADVIYTWNLKHFRAIDPKLAK